MPEGTVGGLVNGALGRLDFSGKVDAHNPQAYLALFAKPGPPVGDIWLAFRRTNGTVRVVDASIAYPEADPEQFTLQTSSSNPTPSLIDAAT